LASAKPSIDAQKQGSERRMKAPMIEKLSGTRGEIYEQNMVSAIFAPWASDLVDSAQVRPGERVLDVA
jgi:hypothetical protein